MEDGKDERGFARVRDGVLDHHREMSYPEIAVFHHLVNKAIRSPRKGRVGLCKFGTRALAEDMGKSRGSILRAVKGLEDRHYVERTDEGILVLNFNGDSPQPHPKAVHGKDRYTGRTGTREVPPPVHPVDHPRYTGGTTPGTPEGPPNRSETKETIGDVMSASSKPPKRSVSKFLWDPEKKRVWGSEEDRQKLKAKWLSRGFTADEFQAELAKMNLWLEDRPGKRKEGSNFANRMNNWLNNALASLMAREVRE
jgi:hypothetical protein